MTPWLSEGQREALVNLGRKKAGATVGWINISDACALADLGLAQRTRAGWVLSAAGEAQLAEQLAGSETTGEIVAFANDKEPEDGQADTAEPHG